MALFKKSDTEKASKEIAKERLIALIALERNPYVDNRSFVKKAPLDSTTHDSYFDD